MKHFLRVVLGVLLLFIAVLGGLFASAFIGKKPIEPGSVLNGHGVTIDDGYAASFLLPAGQGVFAIVDCGNSGDAHGIKEALKTRGADATAVKAIFLTHGHPDHIAGCREFPQADVYAYAEDAPMAAGEKAAGSPMGRLVGAQTTKTVKVSKPLADGQEVVVGDLTVRAFHIPGHTQGSAAYLARGVLYLGDTVKVKTDDTVSNAPWLFTDDQAQNARSVVGLVKRLKAENAEVKAVAFSHTGPLSSLDPLLGLAAP